MRMEPDLPQSSSGSGPNLFPRGAGLGRPTPWLRHVFPERYSFDPSDLTRDALQTQLETIIGAISLAVKRQHGADEQTAVATGADLVMGEALALQRQHAPRSYRAMIISLATHDPALADLRADLFQEVRKAGKRGFRRGALFCALCTLAGLFAGGLLAFPHLG